MISISCTLRSIPGGERIEPINPLDLGKSFQNPEAQSIFVEVKFAQKTSRGKI